MIEYAVSFPAARPSMVGVYTDAESSGELHAPAMVFLNAGLIHRVGPNRLYVMLARAAACSGFNSLRFDRSGIGDSAPRNDGLSLKAAALRDVEDAFDFLSTSCGISSFVLVGLCSGADLAYRVAVADKRVVGLVLIDGLPYRNFRSRMNDRRALAVALARAAWRRLRTGHWPAWRSLVRLGKRDAAAGSEQADVASQTAGRDIPPRAEAESGLRELVARGAQLLVIFTRDRGYNYAGQFTALFPRVPAGSVKVEYFEWAGHTFDLLASQDRFVQEVGRWTARFRTASPGVQNDSSRYLTAV